ncbi:hypothetical protein SFUMM280S_07302 [Streptomyces fumanus]
MKVYWAMSRPSRTTYGPLDQPVLLTNSPNTNDAGRCRSGAKVSAPTMTRTPTTCHHTLTLFSRPTMRTPKVLSSPCSSRMAAKRRTVRPGVTSKPNWRFR